MGVNAILRKAGMETDGKHLDFFNNGGIMTRGFAQCDMIYNTGTTKLWPVGTRFQLGDRVFRYAKAGGTLVAGVLCQNASLGGATTLQTYCTVSTAGVAGAKTVTVTILTDTLTANQFAGGYLMTDAGTAGQGGGQVYMIKSHPAGSGNVVFTLYDKQVIAIGTSAKVTLLANKYLGVVAAPASPTGIPVGVPLIAVSGSTYYAWLQTWGPCLLLTSEADITLGSNLVVAGSANDVMVETGTGTVAFIGHAILAHDYTGTKSSDYVCVDLRLAP